MTSEPLFIETIRLANGAFQNLDLHQARMERTCREVFGTKAPPLILNDLVAETRSIGFFKCRVTYSRHIEKIEFEPYTPTPPRSLCLVECDDIDYHLKYADRSCLRTLRTLAKDKDDILIVRHGLLTDTSYANIVLHTPHRLLTPARPLLEGVMRQRLIADGTLCRAELTPADLLPGNTLGITAVSIINAMLPPELASLIPLSAITRQPV